MFSGRQKSITALDAELDMVAHLDNRCRRCIAGLNEADISERTAGELYVAALREAFEEVGRVDGTRTQPTRALTVRGRLHCCAKGMANTVLAQNGAARAGLVPWTRWITPTSPSVMSKRF